MVETNDSIYDDPEKLLKADAASAVVLEHYRRSKDSLVDKMRDKWNEWYKAYRAFVNKKEDDDVRSNLVIPIINAHVEALIPRTVVNRPRIEVWGRGPEDKLRAAQHRALLKYDWDLMGMAFKIVNFVKSAAIFGTSWYKVYHKREARTRVVKRVVMETRMFAGLFRMGEEPVLKEVEEQILTWDDPQVEVLEPDEIFPDPDGKDEDSCRWIIHRYPVDLDTLELAQDYNGEPLYDSGAIAQLKKLAKHGNPEGVEMDETVKMERQETFGPEMRPNVDPHKRRFYMLEHWSDDKVVSVIEGFPDVKPLRNDRNPYGIKPLGRYTPIPDPNALLGISLAEVLFSIQLETSTLHNVRMDHIVQGAHQMHTIRKGAGINPRQVRWRPGGSIYVNDHDDIKPLDTKPLEFAAYRESEDMRLWAQQVGVTDTFMGVRTGATGDTATEATILQQASASRAGLMFQILGMQALNRMGKILMRINEHHISDERLVRIIGDEFVNTQFQRVTPEELASGNGMDLDVIVDIAETEPANAAWRRKDKMEAIQTLGAIYQDPNHPVLQRLIAELLETYNVNDARELASQPATPPGPQGSPPAPSGIGTAGDALAAAGGASAPGTGA